MSEHIQLLSARVGLFHRTKMNASQLTLVAVLLLEVVSSTHLYERPNIVVILADDLGWNDVSFHGSNQIPTPNIDALAYNGIILNSHYVPALCTPSRSSLLTGKYPTSTGMQHLVILEPEPWGLPLSERLMPEYLQAAGYSTHAIGKWHLGFFKKEYTPLFRGFDSHYGYYNGFQDYYDHTVKATFAPYKGYDMRRNMSVDWDAKGSYSTDLFTNEAVRTINNHNVHQGPLFMYLAHLAPHTGNQEDPFQAPDEEIAKFGYIEDPERRVYAAMVSKVDQSVGEVVSALRMKGMLDNTIIVFMSDNGAPTHGIHSNRGSNWPLRGMKHTAMEGGLRGVAAIWSPLLNNTQRVSNQLMHISDWLPTFYSAAGLNVADLGEIDGVDMWRALSDNLPSPRTEILHNIDEIENYAAMRSGDWKYITGTAQGGRADKWYGESGLEDTSPTYDTTAVLRSKAGSAIIGLVTKLQLREKEERFAKLKENDSSKSDSLKKHATYRRLLSKSMILSIRQQAQVSCSSKLGLNPKDPMAINMTANEGSRRPEMDSNNTACNPAVSPCLFNIHNDPCETENLASIHPRIITTLEDRLENLRTTMVKPRNTPGDPNANPVFWNDTWTSWLDDIKEEILTTEEVHNTSLPPRPTLAPSPVTILTIIASLFGIIVLILMAVILKMYLINIPDAWSLFSISLTKDNKPEELSKQKNIE